ncbi:unnamed protein product [Rotaria magnacalcarata]|uniref:Carboxylesterase type B domain-containing protein n=1 Tax=Rotaria magnacalcarata TaxID=392030 RepID=A0A819PYP2_9BILA|nr:unnamed protein product [Rotaria magnacalcarata]
MMPSNNAYDGLETRKGRIYGRQTEHSIEYLGFLILISNTSVQFHRIQYATANRWQPPMDLASELFSNRSLEATSFGPCCPQRDTGIYIPKQDEQCLYLNIFTPFKISHESLLPVLVWVHGGGLISGCSTQSIPLLYNGTNIIRHSLQQPVIIVTINYRLGIFAEMYLTELIEENFEWPTAGNYNYLDILSALRWINRNIHDYGGDPNNILLFGESSGGRTVVDMGALKGSSNLYHHIISQSGALATSLFYSNMSFALQKSNEIVEQLNCSSHESASFLTCLRNTDINDLLMVYGNRPLKSVIDGYFFSYYPSLAIQCGTYNQNINMIMGANKYEEPYYPIYPDMNSEFAIFIITEVLGRNRAPTVINYFELNNCSSSVNDTNRCCDITRFIINAFISCGFHRVYNNIYLKYDREDHNLFWYNMDCNSGICPKLSKEEGAGLCLHQSCRPVLVPGRHLAGHQAVHQASLKF